MKQRKAQIQLGESIFVVIIITLMLVFGIVFYSGAQRDSLDEESNAFKDLETISITQYVTSLTELECSLQEVQFPNCFDKSKLDAFVLLIEEEGGDAAKEFYFSQLGNANLTLTQIYPETTDKPWQLYYNEPRLISVEGGITLIRNQARVDIPVTILDPITNKYSFGVISIIKFE